jgi:hypothetical protein
MRAALERFFFSGSTPERLGATRLLLGFLLLPFFALEYGGFYTVDPFGARFRFIDPIWYFDALGITRSVPLLPMIGAPLLLAALVGFALGWRTRGCAIAALALIPLLKGFRDSVAGDVHHRELIPFHILLFFACSRCGEVGSLDARRSGSAATIAEWEASWPIQASQLYVATFYCWSGIAKLRGTGLAWFDVDTVRFLMFQRAVRFGVDDAGAIEGFSLGYWLAARPGLLLLPAVGVAAMELGFPVILWLRKLWQRAVFAAGVSIFHVANFVLLNVMFLFMPAVLVLYFDPSRFVARVAPGLAAAKPSG